jgi:hypothetical protein
LMENDSVRSTPTPIMTFVTLDVRRKARHQRRLKRVFGQK